MPTIEDETVIDAPIDEVFEFLASPENHTTVLPSVVDVSNVEELPDGGHEGDFTFKMFGVHLDGHFEDVEFDPPNRRVHRTQGGLEGTVTYDLEPVNEKTRFMVTYEFETPGPETLDRLSDPIATRYMQRETDAGLENVQMMLEELQAEA